jgi:hypothetical protein
VELYAVASFEPDILVFAFGGELNVAGRRVYLAMFEPPNHDSYLNPKAQRRKEAAEAKQS